MTAFQSVIKLFAEIGKYVNTFHETGHDETILTVYDFYLALRNHESL